MKLKTLKKNTTKPKAIALNNIKKLMKKEIAIINRQLKLLTPSIHSNSTIMALSQRKQFLESKLCTL